ncbi:hypothetical protein ABT040_40445 [Streptomyces sp. NPDC002688]|uniref:hypothetical protein n=1 Tax=Streptomyces sp. NPDC002688 TaxID=3154423 RepID=UPI00331B00A1
MAPFLTCWPCWFGVDRSTIIRAIGEVRRLVAQRGCTIAPDVRLRSLAQVVEYLGADGRTGIIDGTEIRVRRPAAGRKDRDNLVSGKTKQNAVKSMVLTVTEGRVLFCSPAVAPTSPRPGSWGWPTSCPTDPSWRCSRMPAIRAWEHRRADAW